MAFRNRKRLIGITFLIVLFVFGLHQIGATYYSVPPPAKTGAPGEVSCMILGCHPAFGIKGSISVKFNNGVNVYYPDSIYDMELKVVDAGNFVFGFQLTALDLLEDGQGNLVMTNTSNTYILNALGREYISHYNAFDSLNFGVDSHIWQFQWKAPPVLQDTIVFYFAGIAANQVISVPTGDFFMNNLAITATTVNLPPIASDQNLTLEPDSILVIDLTASAFDPNGDSVVFSILGMPDSGLAIQLGPGDIQYDPNPGFIGQDSIVYEVCDGSALCDTGIIYIQVAVIPGLREGQGLISFRAYPNPFSEFMLIKFENPKGIQHTLYLYNHSGELVRTIKSTKKEEIIIEKGSLCSGIYVCQLTNTAGRVLTQKVVIH